MLRRQRSAGRPSRAGFTLVEILLVIAIIAILIALLLPAVMRAWVLGAQTQNFSQIGEITTAIGLAKEKLKLPQIPPGPFRLKTKYNGTEPELLYLTAAWPQVQWTNGGYYLPFPNGVTEVVLDTNQTLAFFLTGGTITNFTGFATNPSSPFTAANVGDRRIGPFLQMSKKYFVIAGAQAQGYAAPMWTTTSGVMQTNKGTLTETITVATQNPPQAWLVDPYGMPYAYFAALNGQTNLYCAPAVSTNVTLDGNGFVSQAYAVGSSTVTPYLQSASQFFNPQGFQIISSGKDMLFGPGGSLSPMAEQGYDDVTSFSKTVLGGGVN